MTSPEHDPIAAAFERELARSPLPPGLRAEAVRRAVHDGRETDPNRQPWALTLVAAVLAIAIVTTLVFGYRALHPRGSVPATVPGASPSAEPTAATTPSPTAPMAISVPSFQEGEVGVAYGPVTLSATGGTPTYHWAVIAGALPSGLTLDPNGVVSGTPTSAGGASFTLQVSDSGYSDLAAQGSMTIAPALTAGYLSSCSGGKCFAEVTCNGVWTPAPERGCGKFGYAGGGAPPYTCSITAGRLPPGTNLNGLVVEGLFSEAGTYMFEVTVTDGLGGKATFAPTFTVVPGVWLNPGTCTGDYRTGCSVRLPINGGAKGTVTVDISINGIGATPGQPLTLPPGVTAVVSGGAVVITFPKGIAAGWKGIVFVQIADQYTSNAMSPA